VPFLSAQWRHLAMLNYEVDPSLLAPRVPYGTELDAWQGRHYVSLVGFLFLDTRVLGVPIPFHRTFEEVNLRFYVRRKGPDGWRRGVTFVKEMVPRAAIALVARTLYNEPYASLPMGHDITPSVASAHVDRAAYSWRIGGRWNSLAVRVASPFEPLAPGSEAEFIAEHYWGYTAQRDGRTIEYHVQHPPWNAAPGAQVELDCDIAATYGDAFASTLRARPTSAFLADGSPITVSRGVRLPTP
jgi:uncharacterized protein YqjF (DUF2071 family)